MRGVLTSIVIAVALGIIALFIFAIWGLSISSFFKASQITDKQLTYAQIQYYNILYQRCMEDNTIENKSICQEYLNLSMMYNQQAKERDNIYNIWGNPLLYIILIVIVVVIGILIRIGAIQIPEISVPIGGNIGNNTKGKIGKLKKR